MNNNYQNYKKTYTTTELPELGIISYTQNQNDKIPQYMLDNIYFKSTNKSKIDIIYDIVNNGNYIIFDTETNGINNFGDSLPFQIAAIKYRNGEEVNRLNLIINIGDIPAEILTLTNYKQEDIDNGIDLSDAVTQFNQFVKGEKYIIAHNASFDVSIINNALVATNTYIDYNINIFCSMQIYYTIYKHVFELGISGSSLDQLSHILLGISISEENRHQADYDIMLVKELLDKIKQDVNYDLSLPDSNSAIKRVLNIENSILDKIRSVEGNVNSKNIVEFVHGVGEEIYSLYNEYYNTYYLENLDISNAVSKFLEKSTGDFYPEIFLKDELLKLTYYIRKNKPFRSVDKKYMRNWYKTVQNFYTDNNLLISFFIENPLEQTKIEINSEEELAYYIEKYVSNKNVMMKMQMRIQYLLKIIKAHQKKSFFNRYGRNGVGLFITQERELGYAERTIDIINIKNDINKGLIENIDDLFEVKDYNTTLLVEQNLSNIFKI